MGRDLAFVAIARKTSPECFAWAKRTEKKIRASEGLDEMPKAARDKSLRNIWRVFVFVAQERAAREKAVAAANKLSRRRPRK